MMRPCAQVMQALLFAAGFWQIRAHARTSYWWCLASSYIQHRGINVSDVCRCASALMFNVRKPLLN